MAPTAAKAPRRSSINGKKVQPGRVPGKKARPPHPGEAERIAERRAKVWELRTRQSLTYAVIARKLSVDKATICRDIEAIYASIEIPANEVSIERRRTLDQVDEIVQWLTPTARKGNPKAAATILRAFDRRARLLGLDAPMRVQPVAPERPFEAMDDAALAAQVAQARAVVDAAP